MPNDVTIDPRYLTYDKAEVEDLLGRVKNAPSEEDVRNIVRNYQSDADGGDDSPAAT